MSKKTATRGRASLFPYRDWIVLSGCTTRQGQNTRHASCVGPLLSKRYNSRTEPSIYPIDKSAPPPLVMYVSQRGPESSKFFVLFKFRGQEHDCRQPAPISYRVAPHIECPGAFGCSWFALDPPARQSKVAWLTHPIDPLM